MDGNYQIRPFRDDDFEADARIGTMLFPNQPTTAEESRRWDRAVRGPGLYKEDLAVEERPTTQVVATGSINHHPFAYDPDWYWISVTVDPGHQRRGIGSELYRRLEGTAVRRGAKGVWASVREDQIRGVRFFRQTGFSEVRRGWVSRLDLTEPAAADQLGPADPPAGSEVEFTTLAAEDPNRTETLERFYRLTLEAGRDVPHMGRPSDITFEQFRELYLGPEEFFPEGIFLARVGDEYVATTTLAKLPLEPEGLRTPFTGTLRPYRGRGLGHALKRRAIAFARSRGYRFIRTGNDSLNLPMWSINQRLGFQKEQSWIFGEKKLGPSD